CLMQFLARELDDPQAAPCGKCTPCQGKLDVMRETPPHLEQEAIAFLQRWALSLRPRKQWPTGAMPTYGWSGKIKDELRAEVGRALCVLKDGGWGRMLYQAKYREGCLDASLVRGAADLVGAWKPDPRPAWIATIPSKHAHL